MMSRGQFRYLLKEIRNIPIHMEYGEHSDIPKCCILYFVLIWQWFFIYKVLAGPQASHPKFMAYYNKLVEQHEYTIINNELVKSKSKKYRPVYHYIPCPLCLFMNKVAKIKNCDKEGCQCNYSISIK
jgi:hypothetical protein